MAEKSRRRLMLEQSLAEDPADPFLRYGLAMQCLNEGDVEEGRRGSRHLIADRPDDQVAAYQQLGQSYAADGRERGRESHSLDGHREGPSGRRLARSGRDGTGDRHADVDYDSFRRRGRRHFELAAGELFA